jgi:hypothetical protein
MELTIAFVFIVGLGWIAAAKLLWTPKSGRSASKLPILDAEFEPVSSRDYPIVLALPPNLESPQDHPLFLSASQRAIQAYRLQSLPPGSWPATSKKWQA